MMSAKVFSFDDLRTLFVIQVGLFLLNAFGGDLRNSDVMFGRHLGAMFILCNECTFEEEGERGGLTAARARSWRWV